MSGMNINTVNPSINTQISSVTSESQTSGVAKTKVESSATEASLKLTNVPTNASSAKTTALANSALEEAPALPTPLKATPANTGELSKLMEKMDKGELTVKNLSHAKKAECNERINNAQATLQKNVDKLQSFGIEIEDLDMHKVADANKEAKSTRTQRVLHGLHKFASAAAPFLGAVASIAAIALTGGSALAIAGVVIGTIAGVNTMLSKATDGKINLAKGVSTLLQKCHVQPKTANIIGKVSQMALAVAGMSINITSAAKAGKTAGEICKTVAETVVEKVVDMAKEKLVDKGIDQLSSGTRHQAKVDPHSKSIEFTDDEIDALTNSMEDYIELVTKDLQSAITEQVGALKEATIAKTQIEFRQQLAAFR